MFWSICIIFFLVAERSTAAEVKNIQITLEHDWAEAFKLILNVRMNESVSHGWRMSLHFSKPVAKIEMWRAIRVGVNKDRTFYAIKNMYFNANLDKGQLLTFVLLAYKVRKGERRANVTGLFKPGSIVPTFIPTGEESTMQPITNFPNENSTMVPSVETISPSSVTPTNSFSTSSPGITPSRGPTVEPPVVQGCPSYRPIAPNPITYYTYNEVLHTSILFYEAQRSGKLPDNNRVIWRKDSALGDRGENNEDLTGGWYDAGDYVKFGFPMAYSVTVLAWGLVEYRDAYQAAGELENVLDSIKWPLDYFMKAHTGKFEFYGQVGDGQADHAYWGRPEDQTLARPSFKITPSKPGSDLAAETAAALAAASIAFRETQPEYARRLLRHAAELYEFAESHRGKYSDSIPAAAKFYPSSSDADELSWAAAWLYRATSKKDYIDKAEKYYRDFSLQRKVKVFNWDKKQVGVQLLLAMLTGNSSYGVDTQQFLDGWVLEGDVSYTPRGLAWREDSASNSIAANAAFLALVASDLRIKPNIYRGFAMRQIHYMLGESGQSFVVGFGVNSPQKPRHRASSCPLAPTPCTWENYSEPGPNPQALLGALVGGPDPNSEYADDRSDAKMNHVAVHFNAGFQSAVAGIRRLQMMGRF